MAVDYAEAYECSEKMRERLLDAIGALTDAEDKLSCIPAGPERDELQRLYDAERSIKRLPKVQR